jgi:hypothetical protein
MKIIIMLGSALVCLIVISTYHFIKIKRCLKKHQKEWNEHKKTLMRNVPNITQDELMQIYLIYCKEIKYSYMPRF